MYHKIYNTRQTPQSRPIPGREAEMIKNEAGGYAFQVSDWTRLERFLILGAESGTYYVGKTDLVIQNAQAARRCLKEDGKRVVDLIADISINYRAAKMEPASFVLAMAMSEQFSDVETRRYAFVRFNTIIRTGGQLLQFIPIMESFGGWGRLKKDGIAGWYHSRGYNNLAYQVAKYRQRGGWSHRDVLRLAHPKPISDMHNNIYRWILGLEETNIEGLEILQGFELAKKATSESEIVSLIKQYNLPREMIPTNWLSKKSVWEVLLQYMPLTALIRNLGKMTSIGLIAPFSDASRLVTAKLSDTSYLRASKVHPWTILNAHYWYTQGHGMLGSLTWNPVSAVTDILDDAFHNSFGNVQPSGKRTCLCIDVSGSMSVAQITVGAGRAGALKGMKASAAAGAMALATARVERDYEILLFNTMTTPAHISRNSTLREVIQNLHGNIRGGTDYSSPIMYAANNNIPVDTFVVYGDEQSWYGRIHPSQAMKAYRQKLGINAKLIIVNMCSTNTTVADPKDENTINLIGFDTNAPKIISAFS